MSNVASLGPVDPELLQLRLGTLRHPQERTLATAIVNTTFACLTRINNLDFTTLEREQSGGSTRQLWTAAETPISLVWRAIEELRHAAKPLADEHEVRLGDSEEVSFADNEEFLASAAQSQAVPLSMTPIQRIGETVWATSFVLMSEVESFRKRLPALLNVPDPWELLSDLQDHMGHVKAALQAILTGIYTSLYPTPDGTGGSIADGSHDEQSIELMASRELRQRIFALRDDVLAIETSLLQTPTGDWQVLLKRVLEALDGFMFGPGFAWMRAGDKRTFITQHRGLREILEIWSPLRATPARRAVQNLARYLEALEVINQRECLVLHDRAALTIVVTELERASAAAPPDRPKHIAAGLASLADAQGRDNGLDQLLEATLAPGSPVPMNEILTRARGLLARLQR